MATGQPQMAQQTGEWMSFWKLSRRLCLPVLVVLASLPLQAWAVSCVESDTGGVERIPIAPGSVIELEFPAESRGMLLEEFGGDLSVRTAPQSEFIPISIRPNRLGIAAVRAAGPSVSVKLDPAHAAAVVVVRNRCASEGGLLFFEMLQVRFEQQIEAGAEKARIAIPEIERELAASTDPVQRAWLLHASANAIMSAGLHEKSIDAFLLARDAWTAIADPARAAVALLAAAEDHSRAGKYDRADELLRQAQKELETAGASYYALRAQAQQCVVLSRRGQVKEAVLCETKVADRYEALGEVVAAGTSGVSIANQWMKLGNFDRAREHLLAVDRHAKVLPPVTRARLHGAFGNYYLQTGELDGALRELGAASGALAQLGLPKEQATFDIQLSLAAHKAGAFEEELRLLQSALGRIQAADAPDRVASASIRLATALMYLRGDIAAAKEHAERAIAICEQLVKSDCLERGRLLRVRLLIESAELDAARAALMKMPDPQFPNNKLVHSFLSARLDLERNQAEDALSKLAQLPAIIEDPDLALERSLVQMRALLESNQAPQARLWLDQSLASMAGDALALSATALRATARHRLARLQSHIFDLVEVGETGQLAADERLRLDTAVNLLNPRNHLRPNRAVHQLSLTQRVAVSGAVAGAAGVDHRAIFLAMTATTTAENDEQRLTSPSTDDGFTLLIYPLAGAERFRMLARHSGSIRQCMAMPREDFDELAARFEDSLEGRPADLRTLQDQADRFFQALTACHPHVARRWKVVLTPGTRALPWAWIVASAESRGLPEPLLSLQFSTQASSHPILKPRSAFVLNLDLAGPESLPGAAVEAGRVQAAMEKAGLPVGSAAGASISAERMFAELAAPSQWVHLIGHGNNSRYGALYSGLWLPGSAEPLLVAFPEIATARLAADLVVVSACGDASVENTFVGSRLRVVEALLAGGVGSVVASSNAASDSAASVWAPALYQSVLANGDLARAAGDARSLLRKSPHFRHPKFWAGLEVYLSDTDSRHRQ